MEDNSKDAELRARVPLWMFDGMTNIAATRGEQTPVILREAVAEYLARRVASAPGDTSTATAENILHVLHDRPDIAETLIMLGQALKVNSPGRVAAVKVVGAAVDSVRSAPIAPKPPVAPVKYPVPHRSKKH